MPLRFLPQRLDVLDDALTVAENVARFAPGATNNRVRARLAHFLFRGARADQRAGTLSGGERFRAALAALMLAEPAPQLLMLDEPTNNLDMASVRRLTSALESYEGRWSWPATTCRSWSRSASPGGCCSTGSCGRPRGRS